MCVSCGEDRAAHPRLPRWYWPQRQAASCGDRYRRCPSNRGTRGLSHRFVKSRDQEGASADSTSPRLQGAVAAFPGSWHV
ncbi:hypothetical protein NDU88_001273 [Pleurodeles waltl]|uniref:Uncharacterized protein n=1 Tax=Pleurodeles waltl TaxID=8319 RepID=A0AAV7V7Z2_PLEWA|nr:hypothetical protein NDU88_001273 [Pleurodeles waltl]